MAKRENRIGRPAASRSRDADRSQMLAIMSEPEQSCERPPKRGAEEEEYTRLAKILVPMLREAMDYEAAQADSETKGASNDPET